MRNHYLPTELQYPVHKITVDLVGLGGTGSRMLTELARMNEALMGLGQPGLHVRAWDMDDVTPANMGRQLFSASDLGANKAVVLISRVNRFFGTEWEARPEKFKGDKLSNILITCIDTARGRVEIGDRISKHKVKSGAAMIDVPYYWLDMGNLQHTGQCILGTLRESKPPASDKKGKRTLKTVVQAFPSLKRIKEEAQGPSCSLAEALEKQDLFINTTLANFGGALLWKLLRQGVIRQHGCYINLETMRVNPIAIK